MAWCKKIGKGGGNLVPAMWAPFVYRHFYTEKLMKSVRENIFIEVLEKRLLSFLHSQNTGKFYLKTNMLTKLKADYRQSFI